MKLVAYENSNSLAYVFSPLVLEPHNEYAQDVQGAGLNELESVAREKKKGLWQDANPIYPAEFRRSQK